MNSADMVQIGAFSDYLRRVPKCEAPSEREFAAAQARHLLAKSRDAVQRSRQVREAIRESRKTSSLLGWPNTKAGKRIKALPRRKAA